MTSPKSLIGGTRDGVSAEDWDVVHEFAVEIVNASDDERVVLIDRLRTYLDGLAEKYGDLPTILATQADYLDEGDPRKESLLLRAWDLSLHRDDVSNRMMVAHSLATHFQDVNRLTGAQEWANRLQSVLRVRPDRHYAKEHAWILRECRKRGLSVVARGRRGE